MVLEKILTMSRIFKTYFENVKHVNHAFSEIGMNKGIFLLRNAYGVIQNDCDLNKVISILLSDHSYVHIMSNEYFHKINCEEWLSFDWTEIYLFKGGAMNNVLLSSQEESISKSDLYANFPQQCDFWAASIDGSKLWLTSDNDTAIQNIFLSHSDKSEEQNDLAFFNMVCNDLLFSI